MKNSSVGLHARLTPVTKSPPVASTLDCPSASEIRVSAVALLMNATLRPSGENTPAPDVPLTSSASGLSSRRTKRRRCPFLNPTIAMALPSGAIAMPPWRPATGSTSVGKTTSRWTTSRVVEAGARHHAHPEKATAASAIAHGSACLIRGLAAVLARRATIGCAVDASSATRASPMSRSRRSGSRSRQRASNCLMCCGVSGGSLLQSISPRSVAARLSESVSPRKTCSPVSISNTTTPNAQMSARLSAGLPRACSGLM